jgi:hypothetical protein
VLAPTSQLVRHALRKRAMAHLRRLHAPAPIARTWRASPMTDTTRASAWKGADSTGAGNRFSD